MDVYMYVCIVCMDVCITYVRMYVCMYVCMFALHRPRPNCCIQPNMYLCVPQIIIIEVNVRRSPVKMTCRIP